MSDKIITLKRISIRKLYNMSQSVYNSRINKPDTSDNSEENFEISEISGTQICRMSTTGRSMRQMDQMTPRTRN